MWSESSFLIKSEAIQTVRSTAPKKSTDILVCLRIARDRPANVLFLFHGPNDLKLKNKGRDSFPFPLLSEILPTFNSFAYQLQQGNNEGMVVLATTAKNEKRSDHQQEPKILARSIGDTSSP